MACNQLWSKDEQELFQKLLGDPTTTFEQLHAAFPTRDTVDALYKKAKRLGLGHLYSAKRIDSWKTARKKGGFEVDPELVEENVRLAKQRQRYMDSNRIERKSFREYARIENATEEYTERLVALLEQQKFTRTGVKSFSIAECRAAGVIHLTDLHLNELIDDIEGNAYGFPEAAQRLRMLAERARTYFKVSKVHNVLIAMSGDLLNSDRRLDELLNQATNRSRATFLAVELLQQFIRDLQRDFNIYIVSVSGNESRVKDEWSFADAVASDNYDFTIVSILRYLFRDSVTFIEADSATETLVAVAGQGVLLTHGFAKSHLSDVERAVMQVKGRYAGKKKRVDFVLLGHLHSARIGDTYARSSSLAGANSYSEYGLQLESRASQNVHIFYKNGNRDSIKVDLQNCVGVVGYPMDKALEAYHVKSAGKLRQKKTIFEVVV
jgi:predicted phosphodiesterase